MISAPRTNPIDSSKITVRTSIILLFISLSFTIALSLHLLPTSLMLEVAYAQTATFNNPVPIDEGPGNQVDSHIASAGNTAYTTWSSEEPDTLSKILFAKTSNGGTSFDGKKTLSDDGGEHFAFLSDIAVSGDNVYVVWTDVTDESDILFIKSADGGNTFTQPIKLNNGNVPDARQPRIAVSGSNVYVTWQDFTFSTTGFDSDILLAVSTDNGDTFGNPINASDSPGTLSRSPAIAAVGDDVYLVLEECEINGTNCNLIFIRSADAGNNFVDPVTLSAPNSVLPDISAFDNNVYIVYGLSHTVNSVPLREVFFIKSADSGATFGDPVNLSDAIPDVTRSQNPNLDVSGDNIAVIWEVRNDNADNPHWEVVFRGSTDAGDTFSEPISVSSALGNLDSTLNDITLSGNNVYVVWNTLENSNFNTYFTSGTIIPGLTPEEHIQNLIDTIENLGVKKNTKTSLEGPLHNAIKLLTDSDPTNDKDVCSKLDSFIQQVNSKEQNRQLTSQQAADLRAQARAIETSLGCASANPFEAIPR